MYSFVVAAYFSFVASISKQTVRNPLLSFDHQSLHYPFSNTPTHKIFNFQTIWMRIVSFVLFSNPGPLLHFLSAQIGKIWVRDLFIVLLGLVCRRRGCSMVAACLRRVVSPAFIVFLLVFLPFIYEWHLWYLSMLCTSLTFINAQLLITEVGLSLI